MFNMLRMDFYRIIRSRGLYIILGFGFLTCFISHITLYSLSNPQVVEELIKAGAILSTDVSAGLTGSSVLEFISSTIFRGGLFAVMMTILATLFIGSDFSSGYIKNIMAYQKQRWKYALSKLITLFIIDMVIFLLYILFFQFMIAVLPAGYTPSPLIDYVWFFISFSALHAGIIAMMLPVMFLTKSQGMGIGVSIVVAGGLLTVLLENLFQIFGRTIAPLSLIMQQDVCPDAFNLPVNLHVITVGISWCIIYTLLGIFILHKKDIA